MSSNDDTDQLLKSLSEIASKTISESTAMPAKAYHSEDFFLIEKQKLFSIKSIEEHNYMSKLERPGKLIIAVKC